MEPQEDDISKLIMQALIPAAIGSGAPAVIGGAQLLSGLLQKKPQYPWMNIPIPESSKKALSNAEYVASQTQLPGYENIVSNIGENSANTIATMGRVADSPAALLSGIQTVNANQNEALQNLGIQGANNWLNNQGAYRNELDHIGSMEWDKSLREFQHNKVDKYVMDNQQRQAKIGSGMQNFVGGVQNTAPLFLWKQMFEQSAKDNNDFREKILGLLGPTISSTNGTESVVINPTTPGVNLTPSSVNDTQPTNFTPSPQYFDMWGYLGTK